MSEVTTPPKGLQPGEYRRHWKGRKPWDRPWFCAFWSPAWGRGNLLCLRLGERCFSLRLPWCVARRMWWIRTPLMNVD